MKRIVALLGLSVLLLGGLLFANISRQRSPAYLLRHYPPTPNLTYVIEHHVRPASGVIFRSDEFDATSTGSATGCEIYKMQQSGSQICQSYSESTVLNAGISTISPPQLARLQTILRALPSGETAPPPLERLLIVSFRDAQTWTTRLYDRAHLPPQIREAALIGGFRGLNLRPQ